MTSTQTLLALFSFLCSVALWQLSVGQKANIPKHPQRHSKSFLRRIRVKELSQKPNWDRIWARFSPVILFPPSLQANENNLISVSIPPTGLADRGTSINLKITISEYMQFLFNQTYNFNVTSGIPAKLFVKPQKWHQFYSLWIEAGAFNQRYTIPGSLKGKLILETDKPIYKPEEQIRFRIFYLSSDMKTISAGNFKLQLWAPNNLVSDIKYVSSYSVNEFVRSVMTVPRDAVTGDWSLEATLLDSSNADLLDPTTRAVAYFAVKSYTLPSFVVYVSSDLRYIVKGRIRQIIQLTVMAKYSFGKMVNGTAEIRAQEQSIFRNISGVLQTSFTLWGVDLSGDVVNVFVTVKDWRTAEAVEAHLQLPLVDSPYRLRYRALKPLLNPRFSFEIMATYADGKVKANLPLVVKGVHLRDTQSASIRDENYANWFTELQQFTVYTDESGLALINVTDVPAHMKMSLLSVITTDSTLLDSQQSQLSFFVPSLFADGQTTYVSIMLNKFHFEQGEALVADLIKSPDIGSVNYFILCNGLLYEHAEFPQSGQLTAVTNQQMTPACVLTVYAVVFTKRFLDAVRFDVRSSCSGRVTTDSANYMPGANVHIKFNSTASTGTVALNAIDRRVSFVNASYSRFNALFGSFNDSEIFDFMMKGTEDRFTEGQGPIPFGLWIEMKEIAQICQSIGGVYAFKYANIADPLSCPKALPTFYRIIDLCGNKVFNACSHPGESVVAAQLSKSNRILTSFPASGGGADVTDGMAAQEAEPQPLLKKTRLLSESQLRSEFPETWLFEDVPLGQGGSSSIERALPHSITNWTLSSAFWKQGEGLCLAPDVEITSVKDSFLLVAAPDVAYVGEQILLKVYAYNYNPDLRTKGEGFVYGLCYNIPTSICAAVPADAAQQDNAYANSRGIVLDLLSSRGFAVATIPMEFVEAGATTMEFYLIKDESFGQLSCSSATLVDAIRKTILIKNGDTGTNETLTVLIDAQKTVSSDNALRLRNAVLDFSEKPSASPSSDGTPLLAQLEVRDGHELRNLYIKMSGELLPISESEYVKQLGAGRVTRDVGDVSKTAYLFEVLQKGFMLHYAIDSLRSPYDGKSMPKKIFRQLEPIYENLETAFARSSQFVNRDGSYFTLPNSDQRSLWLTIAATDLTCISNRKASACESLDWILDQQSSADGSFYFEPDVNSGLVWTDKLEYRQTVSALALITFTDCQQLIRLCASDLATHIDRASSSAVQYLQSQAFRSSDDSFLSLAAATYALSFYSMPKATTLNQILVDKAKTENGYVSWSYKSPTASLNSFQKFWKNFKELFSGGKEKTDSSGIKRQKETALNGFALLAQLRLQNPRSLSLEQSLNWIESQWTSKGFDQLLDSWIASRSMTAFIKSNAYLDQLPNVTVSIVCTNCPSPYQTAISLSFKDAQPKTLQLNTTASQYALSFRGNGKVRLTAVAETVRPVDAFALITNSSVISLTAQLNELINTARSWSVLHICIRFDKQYVEQLSSMVLLVESLTQYNPMKEKIQLTDGFMQITQAELTSHRILQLTLKNVRPDYVNCLDIPYQESLDLSSPTPAIIELREANNQGVLARTYYAADRKSPLVKKFCDSNSRSCKCAQAQCPVDCSSAVWPHQTNLQTLQQSICRDEKIFAWLISIRDTQFDANQGFRMLSARVEMIFKEAAGDSIWVRETSEIDLIQREDCKCPDFAKKQFYLFIGNSSRFMTQALSSRHGYIISVDDFIQRWTGIGGEQESSEHERGHRSEQFAMRMWLFDFKEQQLNEQNTCQAPTAASLTQPDNANRRNSLWVRSKTKRNYEPPLADQSGAESFQANYHRNTGSDHYVAERQVSSSAERYYQSKFIINYLCTLLAGFALLKFVV